VITIEFHYPKSDRKHEGDYWQIHIKGGSELLKTYGDYYHDKGYEKALGFIDGVEYVSGNKIKTKVKHVSDLEDYE